MESTVARLGRWLLLGLLLAGLVSTLGCQSGTGVPRSGSASASGVSGTDVVFSGVAASPGPHPRTGATVEAHAGGPAGTVVATTKTDSAGRFRLDLPAGTYVLVETGTYGMRPAPETVTVEPSTYATVTMTLQTR